jgi:hypothetical protein
MDHCEAIVSSIVTLVGTPGRTPTVTTFVT